MRKFLRMLIGALTRTKVSVFSMLEKPSEKIVTTTWRRSFYAGD